MKVEVDVLVLGVKELEVKKGEKKGKKFHIGHFYDGDNLIKTSIPDDQVKVVEMYKGQNHKLCGYLNMDSKQLYFRSID